jgi:CRP-like cAMP-binding protein
VTAAAAPTLAIPPSPLHAIGQARFFSPLSSKQREQVASTARLREVAAHTDLYTIGDAARCCYVLVRGMVQFNLPLGKRTASIGEMIGSGEFFGWAALIPGGQRRVGAASCATDCVLVEIEGAPLLRLMDRDHSLGYAIMTQVTLLVTSTLTALASG